MRSSKKRAAAAASKVVAAKHSKNTVVSDEVTALLKTVASSIASATMGLMNLACMDIAARGRLVAILADAKRLIDHQLGVKRVCKAQCFHFYGTYDRAVFFRNVLYPSIYHRVAFPENCANTNVYHFLKCS